MPSGTERLAGSSPASRLAPEPAGERFLELKPFALGGPRITLTSDPLGNPVLCSAFDLLELTPSSPTSAGADTLQAAFDDDEDEFEDDDEFDDEEEEDEDEDDDDDLDDDEEEDDDDLDDDEDLDEDEEDDEDDEDDDLEFEDDD